MEVINFIKDSPVVKLVGLIRNYIVLNPLVTGAVLLVLSKGPDNARDHIQQLLARIPLDEALFQTILKVLFGLGAVRAINAKLNDMAYNAFRLGAAPGWDWPREVAVITGGSSGIGLGVVERFAAKGIKVAVLDVQEFPKKIPGVKFYNCSVTSPESVAEAAKAIRRDIGEPTILINNAGVVSKSATILDTPQEAVERVMAVNVLSHWTTVRNFAPAMAKANKGHIVTVASIASFVALPSGADYACSKAAVLAFHEALTAEIHVVHKAPNLLTTVVHPNFVATPLLVDLKDRLKKSGVSFLGVDPVADAIADQVFSKKAAQVFCPAGDWHFSMLRGWPAWLQNPLRYAAAQSFKRPQ
jgi:NAD(P)-dependent dehydrogenase (short-subunit alcohol dehydrogenase family)